MAGTDPVLGVIIPAYNEERSLELVVQRVLQEPTVQQVVIVDDCSTDGTLAAARRMTAAAIADRGEHAAVFDQRFTERLRRRRIGGRDLWPPRDRERSVPSANS